MSAVTETADNPLLDMLATGDLPDFERLAPEHAEPAVDTLIAEAEAVIERCTIDADATGWADLIAPIEEAEDRLERAFSPVAHMHAVMDSPGWREAYQACVPKLTAFSSEVGQNTALYEAVKTLRDAEEFAALDATRQRVITDRLRDFELAGVALPDDAKTRYKEIAQRLAELSTLFEQNLLDATQIWQKHITDHAALEGLPESALDLLAQNAANKDMDGWLITLDAPSFIAVLTHAEDRGLRTEVYEAFSTRASDAGPHAGEYDNSAIMDEILALRHEAAGLLGFDNYAERSLARKMAESPAQIEAFLLDLAKRSFAPAREELAALKTLAAEDGIDDLAAWDISYYAEKLKQVRYDFSDEDLRPYFPAPAVIDGLFKVTQRLYDVNIHARADIPVYHPDVTVYEITDADGTSRGVFYLDPYAREGKRGGAWMHPFQNRRVHGRRRHPEAAGVSHLQLLAAGRWQTRPAHPRRGHNAVPRIRPWPAPHADTRGAAVSGRHLRRGMGRSRAAQPVHGELVLVSRNHSTCSRPITRPAKPCRSRCSTNSRPPATIWLAGRCCARSRSRCSICACIAISTPSTAPR